MALPEDYSLILTLEEDLGFISLEFFHPSFPKPIDIGWNDRYTMWYIFRWEELDLISTYVASQFPKYPAAPFLLLSLFTPVTTDDDRFWIRNKFTESLQSLGISSEDFLQEIIPRPSRRDQWVKNAEVGWVIDRSFRTYSTIENYPFPFEHFQKMLMHLEKQNTRNGRVPEVNMRPFLVEKMEILSDKTDLRNMFMEKWNKIRSLVLLQSYPFYMEFDKNPYLINWKEQQYLVIGQDIDFQDLIAVDSQTKEMYYLVNDGSKKYINGNIDYFLEYVKAYITFKNTSQDYSYEDFPILFDEVLDRLTLLDPKAMEASPWNFWSKVFVTGRFPRKIDLNDPSLPF